MDKLGKPKCKAKAKQTGTQCKRYPVPGAEVCVMHGGRAPQVRAKAVARQQEENIRVLLENLGTPTPIDPGQALLGLIAAKNGEVQWLREVVKGLEQETLTWGTADHEEGFGPLGAIDKTTKKAAVNVWWEMLRKAEDQLASYASQALRAGIEERRVRLAESQGTAVAGVIHKVLDALGLSAEQVALIPEVVPSALRELTQSA